MPVMKLRQTAFPQGPQLSSRDPAHAASPALLRFDFVTVKAGRGNRRPAARSALARAADRFLAALSGAVPDDTHDLPRAITCLKAAADRQIMKARRRARS